MRKTLMSSLAVALLLGPHSLGLARNASAQELKPLAVISFSGYDAWYNDIEFVGKISGNPDLAKGGEAILKLFTRGKGLAGLDKTRPWGAVILTDGENVGGGAFVPVTNPGELLEVVRPFLAEAVDIGDGIYKLRGKKATDKPVYAKHVDGWVFFTDKPENFEHAPADPLALLGELPKQYDLAARIKVDNLPEQLRQQFIDKVNADAARDLKQRPGENDQDYYVRKRVSEEIVKSIVGAANEADQITLGWSLDGKAGTSHVDLVVTAKPNTTMARKLVELSKAKTNFSGFNLPEAALSGNWVGRASDTDAAEVAKVIGAIRTKAFADIDKKEKSEAEAAVGKQFVGDLLDVLQKTVTSGRADGGVAVLLNPDAVTLLAGGYVADGAKLEKLAKQLADIARAKEPATADLVTLDADKCEGVRLHTVSIPIPYETDNRDKVVRMVGQSLDVVVGMGDQSIYVAAGRNAMDSLKQVIGRSAKDGYSSVAPVRLSVALGPIAKFVSEMCEGDDRIKAGLIVSALAKNGGGNHATLVASPVERGVRLRVELEEGLLKLIGSLPTMSGPGATNSL